jgi:uncharacterized membrane protein (UPF0182 family)
MEDTLEHALARIFNAPEGTSPQQPSQQPPELPAAGAPENMNSLIVRASEVFRQSQDALKSGNWADYGARLQELQDILNRLNAMTGQAGAAPVPTTPQTPPPANTTNQ